MPTSTNSAKDSANPELLLVDLGQVLQTLRQADDTKLLLDAVTSYFKTNFAETYGLIWLGLYDRLDHRLVGKGGHIAQGSKELLRQRFSLVSGELLEQVVVQQRPLAMADLRQELRAGEWQRIAGRMEIQGTMMFPITHRDRPLGVLILGSKQWGISPSTAEKACISIVLGEVGAILHRIEVDWQQQQLKRPEKSLTYLSDRLRTLHNFGQRLETVIEESHRFIGASRTSIYWFEPKNRYFWRRISNQTRTPVLLDNQAQNSGIMVQDVSLFYQSLLNDQLITVSQAQSSLRLDVAQKLCSLLRAKSVMAAPILYQRELLGFLAVEANDTQRVWQTEEQQYLKAAAQIIALAAPLESMEAVAHQSQLDHALIADIAQSIYSNNDWRQTVSRAAELLSKRLKIERLLVLLHNPESQAFDICYQTHPRHRRTINQSLPGLSDLDRQLLERAQGCIAIENWDEDLRLAAWRQPLIAAGLKSMLICSTAPTQRLEGVLAIGLETPRAWTTAEMELFQIAAQQLGLILHQWQLQHQEEQSRSLQTNLHQIVSRMQGFNRVDDLQRHALSAIARVTEAPLAFLINWLPGETQANIVLPSEFADKRFHLEPKLLVDLQQDPLVARILQQCDTEPNGIAYLDASHLPDASKAWFAFKQAVGSLIAIPLYTTNGPQECLGIVVVADLGPRRWNERHCMALGTIASQLTWCSRSLQLLDRLQSQRRNLEQVTWYKQRHLETVYRNASGSLQKLQESIKPNQDKLLATRQQQILHQLEDTINPLASVVEQEAWALAFPQEPASLLGVLRRSLDRVDGVIKERQLWSQVHNEGNPLIAGDIIKLEFVLYEIMLNACLRSHIGGRVDVWCRQTDPSWVEVAITDTGELSESLIDCVNTGLEWDRLSPSPVADGMGLNLLICKRIAQQMDAEFSLIQLEDQRIMSRLVIPTVDRQK